MAFSVAPHAPVLAQAQSAQPDVQPFSMKQLFDAAANPLAWQQIAGKTIGVYGGRFLSIARVPQGNNLWLISLRSGIYATDVVSCEISDDSLSVASTFKPNDPVVMIGKLAGAPHDMRPAFDGRCFVASGKQPQGAVNDGQSGPQTPTVTTTLDQFQAEQSNNSVAFEQKYVGKEVRLSGGHVGRIDPNYFVVYQLAGPHKNFPLDAINCYVSPAAKSGIASLNKDQMVTITGLLKGRDETKTANLAPILDNCTFQ